MYNGSEYRSGCYVVCGFEGLLPVFGRVESVLVVAGEPILCVNCVITIGLCEHRAPTQLIAQT